MHILQIALLMLIGPMTFAEHVALSEAVTELKVIRGILEFFNDNIKVHIPMQENKLRALTIARNGNFTKNSKHIEIQYHFVNEYYKDGALDIITIESEENLANLLTMSLGILGYIQLRGMLSVK